MITFVPWKAYLKEVKDLGSAHVGPDDEGIYHSVIRIMSASWLT